MKKLEYKFEWEYCSTCRGYMIRCPKCGNNCCNGGYGRMIDGKPIKWNEPNQENAEHCDVCPLAYQYQELGWKHKENPKPTEEELAQRDDVSKLFDNLNNENTKKSQEELG